MSTGLTSPGDRLHSSVRQAEAALGAGLLAGEAYLNIHTNVVPSGEIRGFLHAAPEPTTALLLGLGLGGLLLHRRRRQL